MGYPGFVPTINLRLPVLSLTLFAHCYPSQTLLWLNIYQKLFSTHMHNWLLLYICRKNTYQSAVIRSISQCLAPKFASLSQPQKSEMVSPCLTPLLILIFSLSLCRCTVTELSVYMSFSISMYTSSIPCSCNDVNIAWVCTESNAFS